jgi:hypothetical protein
VKYLLLASAFVAFTSPAFAVSRGNMPAYCRGQAASEFSTKPYYIKAGKLVRAKDGGYSIKGTADLGDQGKKPFQCDYDKSGNFLQLQTSAAGGGASGGSEPAAAPSLPSSTSAAAKPVSPSNMAAYCRGDVASATGTKPVYVKTAKVVKARDGSYSVKATADLGSEGKKPFECDFDAKGNFLHTKSLVDEGKL